MVRAVEPELDFFRVRIGNDEFIGLGRAVRPVPEPVMRGFGEIRVSGPRIRQFPLDKFGLG